MAPCLPRHDDRYSRDISFLSTEELQISVLTDGDSVAKRESDGRKVRTEGVGSLVGSDGIGR